MADTLTIPQMQGVDAASIYADAAETISAYAGAMRRGDTAELERLLAPIWSGKRAGADDGIELETRAAFIERVQHGGAPATRHLSAVQACFGDFAIARADTWAAPSATLLLLFRTAGVWRIAGEASVLAGVGARPKRFTAGDAERQVLDTLETYYRAVTDGDPDAIRAIFAPCWEMKNHEDAELVSEGVDAFARRLDAPLPGYWDDRQIADVQVIADRLAYVRVDKPSTPSTTVFLFIRVNQTWKVIDKAWADGRI